MPLKSREYWRLMTMVEELAEQGDPWEEGNRALVGWLWKLHMSGRRLAERTAALIAREDRRQKLFLGRVDRWRGSGSAVAGGSNGQKKKVLVIPS